MALRLGPARGAPAYFAGEGLDLMVMGGLSLLLLPVLIPLSSGTRTAVFIVHTLWWFANWPHFAATSARLYGSRSSIAQFPLTAYVIPALVVGLTVSAFVAPDTVAPSFVKLVRIWSIYHFSAQAFGLTLIYARRAGMAITPRARRSAQWFLFATFLARAAFDDSGTGTRNYFGIAFNRLNLPLWTCRSLLVCSVVLGALFVREFAALAVDGRPPIIVLLPALSYFVWFIVASPQTLFFSLVPFFHSVQYLFLAAALREPGGGRGTRRPARQWYLANVIAGIVLFFVLPRVALLGPRDLGFSSAVIWAGIQLHHFFVDGVIWRLRREPTAPAPIRLDPRTMRSLTLLVVLLVYFALFTTVTTRTDVAPALGVAVFAATVGIFRLMTFFERPPRPSAISASG